MDDEALRWKEMNYNPATYSPGKRTIHTYSCEECNYHWEEIEKEPEIEDEGLEDILVEDIFMFREPDACPLCGSDNYTEK